MRYPEGRLARVAWEGEEHYFRVLSYYFSVRWNWEPFGERVMKVLGGFEVSRDLDEERNPPTPGLPPRYSSVRLRGTSARGRCLLLHGSDVLTRQDDPVEVLRHLFWHINSETIHQTGDLFLIHAGAVCTPSGEGLILPAESGSGKSTVTAGLVRAGFGYLSDEAAAIDPITRRLHAYPKALTFKGRHIFGLFPELERRDMGSLVRDTWHFRSEEIRPDSTAPGPVKVRWIVAPRYEEGSPTRLTLLSTAEAAMELGRCALNLALYRSRALPLMADLARDATAYRIVSGDLREVVDAVVELTGEIASRELALAT